LEFGGLKDVPFSVPTILGREGVERILKVGLSSEELKGLSNSAGVIANAIESLRDEEGLE
jgi:L-lactate dehydrogenase